MLYSGRAAEILRGISERDEQPPVVAWLPGVALTANIQRLPEALRRTLTWDQGKEMAEHARFSIDSGVRVSFCDPSSPWQRGTNDENTNGLLRQYFPKGIDLAHYAQRDHAVADELNNRPRQTLALDETIRGLRPTRCVRRMRPSTDNRTPPTMQTSLTPRCLISESTGCQNLATSPPSRIQRPNDAESINRNLVDNLWLGRAHNRQHLNLLGYALMVNGLALHRHRRRQPDQLAA